MRVERMNVAEWTWEYERKAPESEDENRKDKLAVIASRERISKRWKMNMSREIEGKKTWVTKKVM